MSFNPFIPPFGEGIPALRYTPSVSLLLCQVNWMRKLYIFITPVWTRCSRRQCLHFCELLGKIGRNKGSYLHTAIQSRTGNLGKASEANWTLFYPGKLFTGLCINCSNSWLHAWDAAFSLHNNFMPVVSRSWPSSEELLKSCTEKWLYWVKDHQPLHPVSQRWVLWKRNKGKWLGTVI